MTIDRVATAAQTAYFLSQIQNGRQRAGQDPGSRSPRGKNANTYAGFGDKTQVLTATHLGQCPQQRLYQRHQARRHPDRPAGHPAHQPVRAWPPSCKKAVGDAVANNDATTLMTQAQSIFDQASAILNSKDANGDYIYGGGKTDVAPVTVELAGGAAGLARRVAAPSPTAP